MKIKLLLFVFSISLILTQTTYTQTSTLIDEWWLHIPSSPLVFGMPKNSNYRMLNNTSSGEIVHFDIGCIKKIKKDFIRGSILKSVEISLEPNVAYLTVITKYTDLKNECEKQESKLGIVRVKFADGAIWQLGNGES